MHSMRYEALLLVGFAFLAGPADLESQAPAEPYPVIVGVPHDTVFRPEGFGGEPHAGPCPAGWPIRITGAFEAAALEPQPELCRALVRDLNGDGATDAVFTASTPLGPAVVAVLDRPSPLVVNVAPLEPEGGYIYAIESGRHGLSGCFDGPHGEPEVQGDRILDPADGELSFPHGGFGVSDGWWIVYYHFREDGLHQEGGSGC